MNDSARTFSFVEQITALEPGRSVRGLYRIPSGLDDFPAPLVAEAVGQLAAWASMAALDFERRPLAGLGGSIELLAPVRPGQSLELTAELESVAPDAVAYRGDARVDGRPVLRLRDCVGPALSTDEFDDPQALRQRFHRLCHAGAPCAFSGLPPLPLKPLETETAEELRAQLTVPSEAAFFADHFPRRPVFPGSLLVHTNLQLAASLANRLPSPNAGIAWALSAVQDVKLRTFIAPGECLTLIARTKSQAPLPSVLAVETRRGSRVIGSAAVRMTPAKSK